VPDHPANPACTILHVDMDAFFASVEQMDNPRLRGKPVLVGHDGPRGVVAAASYESRVFGCRSAQPISVAKRLCPQAIIVPVRGARYREISGRVFDILNEFSPLIEPISVDEAFVDLAGTERLLGPAEDVAQLLKTRIKTEIRLTASIGVAPNKFLAKLASDLKKPDGLVIIRPEEIDHILPPLPVTTLWGVGKVTAGKLQTLGIRTIGDLRGKTLDWLERHLGSEAQRYFDLSRGIDRRVVTSDREAKSIGHEQTFEVNLDDADEVRKILLDQVELVAARLRRHGLMACGVSLKIRFGDFETISRSATLPESTDSTQELWQAARALFDAWKFQPVRLIGITAERLSKGDGQLPMFEDADRQKQKKLDAVADQINGKFGKRSIRRAGGK
jgi:DNA polymerase-4